MDDTQHVSMDDRYMRRQAAESGSQYKTKYKKQLNLGWKRTMRYTVIYFTAIIYIAALL